MKSQLSRRDFLKLGGLTLGGLAFSPFIPGPVSYTHLRAHETVLDIVCRLLLDKTTKLRRTTHHYMTRPRKIS